MGLSQQAHQSRHPIAVLDGNLVVLVLAKGDVLEGPAGTIMHLFLGVVQQSHQHWNAFQLAHLCLHLVITVTQVLQVSSCIGLDSIQAEAQHRYHLWQLWLTPVARGRCSFPQAVQAGQAAPLMLSQGGPVVPVGSHFIHQHVFITPRRGDSKQCEPYALPNSVEDGEDTHTVRSHHYLLQHTFKGREPGCRAAPWYLPSPHTATQGPAGACRPASGISEMDWEAGGSQTGPVATRVISHPPDLFWVRHRVLLPMQPLQWQGPAPKLSQPT